MHCIAATLSANSQILVVNELTFDDPDETHARTVRKSTFRVYSRFSAANQGLLLDGPNSYWAHPMWSVVFESGRVSCPYTLVTDDGEFLVLFGLGFVGNALTIYRRQPLPGESFGGHGELVRGIPLSELWPSDRIQQTMSDNAPQWYTGGSFSFSADNRTLIHKTRWGQTRSIDLPTGRVTNQ